MGRHVTRSLLLANRPEGWEFVEKLLVAAQRQEGLHQTILECVDGSTSDRVSADVEADFHPKSASVCSDFAGGGCLVWVRFGRITGKASSIVAQVLEFLTDVQQQQAALDRDDAQTVYLAL